MLHVSTPKRSKHYEPKELVEPRFSNIKSSLHFLNVENVKVFFFLRQEKGWEG